MLRVKGKNKIILNAEDSKKFVEVMENPPKPNEKLKALLDRKAPRCDNEGDE